MCVAFLKARVQLRIVLLTTTVGISHTLSEKTVLDLHNTKQSQRAIAQELGTGSQRPSEKRRSNYKSKL